MSVQFGSVRPGIALGANEANRLRGEIDALFTAMNNANVGAQVYIRDFKLDDGRRIPLTATISALAANTITVDLR